ncbi:hypothetical protein CHLNCDRAFT_138659 [Chlorella variabilis]|uniref:Decapping nuclease n=1 Tax=Chlorella variabilis TaxID=554065 RepID=E1ZNH3_CHLVA|nr:hypothetical protein CHLNCDRAFT_138659 [Chlorella variabilis]EFN52607.1 hypothetical protein CHLNCDRAFT_138659 [Chlorella variabilis]|eukprot:XP_005844709.1 hypothetical protein CHLNCDRAFT_138659 [Chlorella variabilis]
MSQPVQVAGWTKVAAGAFTPDCSGLLPFVRPALPASLEGGGYVGKDEGEDVGVEPVVRAAAAAAALQAGCDVLSYRNNLNKIFGVPFDPSSPWAVDACLLRLPGPAPGSGRGSSSTGRGGGGGGSMAGRESGGSSSLSGSESGGGGGGTLFLDIVKVEQAWIGDPAQMEKFTRWGFEALCTGQEVADASSEYGALVRSRLAQHRLLIDAEIDCFDPAAAGQLPPAEERQQAPGGQQQKRQQQPPPLSSYIELKTYKLPQHPGQQRTLHRHKHPKWWLQSFLAGVPRLALGGRDDQARACGMVRRIDLVATADLPGISAAHGAHWSPGQALQFGVAVLGWMREEAGRAPGQHLRFTYAGGSGGGGGRGGAAGSIRCEVVEGGALPQRISSCLRECGLEL